MNDLDEKLQYEMQEGQEEKLQTSISYEVIGSEKDLDSFEDELKTLILKLAVKHNIEVE